MITLENLFFSFLHFCLLSSWIELWRARMPKTDSTGSLFMVLHVLKWPLVTFTVFSNACIQQVKLIWNFHQKLFFKSLFFFYIEMIVSAASFLTAMQSRFIVHSLYDWEGLKITNSVEKTHQFLICFKRKHWKYLVT
jgi:hypothetical protein